MSYATRPTYNFDHYPCAFIISRAVTTIEADEATASSFLGVNAIFYNAKIWQGTNCEFKIWSTFAKLKNASKVHRHSLIKWIKLQLGTTFDDSIWCYETVTYIYFGIKCSFETVAINIDNWYVAVWEDHWLLIGYYISYALLYYCFGLSWQPVILV